MSVEIEAHTAPSHPRRAPVSSTRCDGAIFVGLVNNMPDAALASTEAQFSALLAAAAGSHSVQMRVSSMPEIPRGRDNRASIASGYCTIETPLGADTDAINATRNEQLISRRADATYRRP